MTIENKTIDSAPKDGSILYIYNREKCLGMVASWSEKTSQWEGIIFAPLRPIKIYWDSTDECQPTHWRSA